MPVTPGAEAGVAPPIIALFGPTAIGKTEVALDLAERLGGEIVSADSMQVYRGLPIVTNQPSAAQLDRVRHHLVGVIDPASEFSVAAYARLARVAIAEIVARGRTVVLEGGSGLYLRAGLGGLAFGAPPSPALRTRLTQAANDDLPALVERLRRLDPATAARVDCANPRRVVRALETVMTQGEPLGDDQVGGLWQLPAPREYRLFALDLDRGRVRERVEARVDAMVAAGLLDEVRTALAGGPLSRTVCQAIGVAEAVACLTGKMTLEQAVSATKARTRRLVRRQLTWMRKLPDAAIIPSTDRSPEDVSAAVLQRLT